MLTNEGKNHIKRYMAGYVPFIAGSVSFGIGDTAASATDRRLSLEIGGSPIELTYFDFANNRLVYKAALPDEYVGEIREIGIYSLEENPATEEYASRLITTFDSETEEWIESDLVTATVFDSTQTRVGIDSLYQSPLASTNEVSVLQDIDLSLNGYSAADEFIFAFHSSNANVANVRYRFMTDASNYYQFTFTSPAQGYNIVTQTKGNATVVGTPDWEEITSLEVETNANASGEARIRHDAIRVEDTDSESLDYILVARKVLTTPFVKVSGMAQDIEFTIDVTI